MSIPFPVLFISSIALALGSEPSVLMATLCAIAGFVVANQQAQYAREKDKCSFHVVIYFWQRQ